MHPLRIWRRLRNLAHRRELDAALEDEIRFHLDMKAEDNRAAGMTPEQADHAARRRFGNATLAREASREFWGWAWLDHLAQDLRYALRALRANPGFTAVAVLTLALGIGANTAVFTLINAVILRTLPVKNPHELVLLHIREARNGANRDIFSYPLYKDLRDRNEVLSGLLGHFPWSACLTGGGAAENLQGELVTGNYFQVLGIDAALGRVILPEDDRTGGGQPVCVLSHALWRRRFASDPGVIGRAITLSKRKFTIIGVAPESFTGTEPGRAPALYVPLNSSGNPMIAERGASWLQILGRRKPGIRVEQARAGLQVTLDQIARDVARDAGRVTLTSGAQGLGFLRSALQKPLLVLMAATALVLLIACANLATLLLARAASRRREMAVRLALGAGRARLIRQLLTESLLLAAAGAAAGLLLAGPLVRLAGALLTSMEADTNTDARVFAFLAIVTAAVAVLFGLAPALESTRLTLTAGLKDLAEGVRRGLSLRQALIAGQIALCIVLLVGAGLFVSSLRNLRSLNPGFERENLVLLNVVPSLSGYSPAETRAFYGRALERIRTLPGVRAASLATIAPLSGNMMSQDFTPEGARFRRGEENTIYRHNIAPGYLATLRMPLVLGREFMERDDKDSPNVVIVNDTLAKRFWPGQNPIGKHLAWGDPYDPKHALEIVGVAGNHKYMNLREADRFLAYTPVAQDGWSDSIIHVRAAGDPRALIPALRAEIRALDRNMPIYDIKTMEAQVDEMLSTDRLLAILSTAFAGLALLLAAIGLYGVMAYLVARRTREIGVRIALGAARGDVLRLVLRESALLIATGIALGLPAAWAASRLIAAFLYGLTPRDPAVYAAVTALLAVVALLAAFLPARHATRIEPALTLRCE